VGRGTTGKQGAKKEFKRGKAFVGGWVGKRYKGGGWALTLHIDVVKYIKVTW
jgi:hypothetical protein